jgi:outer membrane PBP1 activator LpoA protein
MYAPQPYQANVPSPYPSMLPPPVPYPKRRWWPIAAVALAVAVVAALVTAIVLASRNDASGHTALTQASAKAAIQEYLDALSKGDDQTVARHTLCGLFDAVKEHRSDLALASLSSDAFRKQYSHVEVTSIDKMVNWSPNQAQVLFTMRVTLASGSTRDQSTKDNEEQAVAQLLAEDNQILVCSYLPRTAGQY